MSTCSPLEQRADLAERLAGLEHREDGAFANISRGAAKTKAHAAGLHGEVQAALVDVEQQNGHAEVAALREVERDFFRILRLDRHQGRHEVLRVVRLKVHPV